MISSAKRLGQVGTYYFAKKLKEIAELNRDGKDIINLGIGSPDLPPPPIASKKLIESLDDPKAHQYQSYYGISQLRKAFSDFYRTYFKTDIDPDKEVLPLIGSKEGIMHITMSFVNPGDHVLVPNPGYPAYRSTTLIAEGIVRTYNLDAENQWYPDLASLEKEDLSKVKLMWINYPHMPTGSKASKTLFENLISFAQKHEILICNDNPYAMVLNKNPLSILSIDGAEDHALELTSLSKSFNMSGWRVGAILGKADYLNTIIKFKSNMDSGMFKPVQIAAAHALQSDPSWFINQDKEYTERRHIVFEMMDMLQCVYGQNTAGLFVWAKVPDHNGTYWSDKLLKEAQVFMTPGFIFGDQGDLYIRTSLCNTVKTLAKAKERIAKIL